MKDQLANGKFIGGEYVSNTSDSKLVFTFSDVLDRRRMSIRDASVILEYRFETVRQLYHGQTKRIPIELIERICDRLDVNVNDIITYEHK